MTSQPEWELVYATDYSALYVDRTGVYDPELAVVQTDDDRDEHDPERNYVYRFVCERLYEVSQTDDETGMVTSYLVTVDPSRTDLPHAISSYTPWFADSLGSIARSAGRTVRELKSALCSDDPVARASAYEDIGGYHGFDNLDSYPEHWTESEFDAWPERGEKRDPSDSVDEDTV